MPESEDFEKRLLSLTRAELSCVLMPFQSSVLASAFKGCTKSFINKMRDGTSTRRFKNICEAFSSGGILDHTIIKEDQEVLLERVKDLEASGTIIRICTDEQSDLI